MQDLVCRAKLLTHCKIPIKITPASDEKISFLASIQIYLAEKGIEVINVYQQKVGEILYFPDVAIPAVRTIIKQTCKQAILLGSTGTGICITVNKISGIRAALCTDAETATGASRWNDANLLCLVDKLNFCHLEPKKFYLPGF